MTTVVLRPNTTVSNTGTVTGAGGVAHTALADDSDATFITFTYLQQARFNMTDLTLPANGVVKTVMIRARAAATVGSPILRARTTNASPPTLLILSSTVTGATIRVLSSSAASGWSDALIDAVNIIVENSLSGGGGGTTLIVYELYFDVVYVAQPVVVVDNPTGTITTTNTPQVSWTDTLDVDGGAQTGYQVKVFTAAQYGIGGFDPAVSPNTLDTGALSGSALSYQPTTVLPNATYRAYVRVKQTVNGADDWSAYAFSGFIINVTPPAVPTLAMTAESTSGRIKALITTGGGATTTDRVELQRSIDGGTTWAAVRNSETTDGTITYPAAPVTIRDYEAPNGTLTSYRARALHNYTGVYAASAWTTTQTATFTSTDWWIKHPTKPALNLKLPGGTSAAMFSYPDVNRVARQGVFQPAGATLPIVVSDTTAAASGTIVIQVRTRSDQDKAEALIAEATVLLLQGPVAHGEPDRYVAFGALNAVRVIDNGGFQIKRSTMPWVQVATPTGILTGADWT